MKVLHSNTVNDFPFYHSGQGENLLNKREEVSEREPASYPSGEIDDGDS